MKKATVWTLNILAACLVTVMVLKLIFWLIYDKPISRGSMLILACFAVCLFIKNRYTYFLSGSLALFCIIYKSLNTHWSGYLMVDFFASMRTSDQGLSKLFYRLPYLFYFLMLLLMFLPPVFKVYWKRDNNI